jgi:hypothetical protein
MSEAQKREAAGQAERTHITQGRGSRAAEQERQAKEAEDAVYRRFPGLQRPTDPYIA